MLPPSDQDLITALGEETARVLGQARQSAIELKNKAEEHARRVVREAQETARELRTTTQQAVEAKTREAEDAARNRAKEIVGEARGLRERVLADLEARRQELERQIADLRAGRGKLVETYELVERALGHAARVMAEEPSTPPDVPAADVPVADVPRLMSPRPTTRRTAAVPTPAARTGSRRPRPNRNPRPRHRATPRPTKPTDRRAADETADESAPDVGALFEKLRSEQVDTPATTPRTNRRSKRRSRSSKSKRSSKSEEVEEVVDDADGGDVPVDGDPATVARDAALAEATDDLVRRGKRALQDEQNDLLDGLRRQRGKIDVSQVLPPMDDQVTRWAHVLQPAVDAAYSAGAATVASAEGAAPKDDAAPRALLSELSTGVVAPLRERLGDSLEQIDARTPADTEIAVAQSLGARYREWRGEPLEGALGDVLAAAWSRGVYDAAPDGARLRWVPAVVGQCPDCDDNALEPTVKGSDFPTGQPHPPAHPGCRCLLVVDAS